MSFKITASATGITITGAGGFKAIIHRDNKRGAEVTRTLEGTTTGAHPGSMEYKNHQYGKHILKAVGDAVEIHASKSKAWAERFKSIGKTLNAANLGDCTSIRNLSNNIRRTLQASKAIPAYKPDGSFAYFYEGQKPQA